MRNHLIVCSCPIGFEGDPFSECIGSANRDNYVAIIPDGTAIARQNLEINLPTISIEATTTTVPEYPSSGFVASPVLPSAQTGIMVNSDPENDPTIIAPLFQLLLPTVR